LAGVHQQTTITSVEEFFNTSHEISTMALFRKLLPSKGKTSRISSREPEGSPEDEVEHFGLFLLKDETATLNNLE
jgi:hypothetical protein